MGIAAYNRGSACIARGIQMDHGTYREPPRPVPRPATWGDKTKARALDRARVSMATATEAAKIAIEEATPKMRIEIDRLRIEDPRLDDEEAAEDEARASERAR
jgi:hypothetical protein